jgi:hypothetical protein
MRLLTGVGQQISDFHSEENADETRVNEEEDENGMDKVSVLD